MQNLILNSKEQSKWFHNLQIFFAPLAVIYLSTVAIGLQDGFNVSSFIPTPATQGAIALYIVNGLLDYLRKVRG